MTGPHVQREWLVSLAFIVLIPSLVGIWFVDHRRGQELRKAQRYDAWARYDTAIAACSRGNVLRMSTNDQNDALHEIGVRLALSNEMLIKLQPIPLVNCFKVIERPHQARP